MYGIRARAEGTQNTTTAIVAGIGAIALVLAFLLAPVIHFSCQSIYVTSGNVSLSCEIFGFGEVYQQAFGVSGSPWSDNCQIHNSLFAQCSVGSISPVEGSN